MNGNHLIDFCFSNLLNSWNLSGWLLVPEFHVNIDIKLRILYCIFYLFLFHLHFCSLSRSYTLVLNSNKKSDANFLVNISSNGTSNMYISTQYQHLENQPTKKKEICYGLMKQVNIKYISNRSGNRC